MRKGALWCMTLTMMLCTFGEEASANKLNQAIQYYRQGQVYSRARQHKKAARSYGYAAQLLRNNSYFNCRRAQFRNYEANAYEKARNYYKAMRIYYNSAYRSGCKTRNVTGYAAKRYRILHYRYTCSIRFTTTPPGARVILIDANNNEQRLGKTPFKRSFNPGKYKFKLRLYEHKTQWVTATLRRGMHIKKNFKLIRGDDPLHKPEKVDIAPPPDIDMRKMNKRIAKKPKKRTFRLKIKDSGGNDKEDPKDDKILNRPNRINKAQTGPPIYKKAWFWATIGVVAAGTTAVIILIPKEKQVLVNQGKLF